MGKKKMKESFQVGNIVEIVRSSDNHAIGCLGEVVDSGPLIRVAVVHVLSFQPNQLKKKLDLAGLSWNELRARAKSLGVKATGTRPELEAKVKERLKDQGRVELDGDATATTPVAAVSRGTAVETVFVARAARDADSDEFEPGERVKVRDDHAEFPGIPGTVTEGDPIQVILDFGLGQHQFSAGDLAPE